MENKNKFIVTEITLCQGLQTVLMSYIPDRNDPKYDDLPSEILEPGKVYNVTFTPVNPDVEEPFNKGL